MKFQKWSFRIGFSEWGFQNGGFRMGVWIPSGRGQRVRGGRGGGGGEVEWEESEGAGASGIWRVRGRRRVDGRERLWCGGGGDGDDGSRRRVEQTWGVSWGRGGDVGWERVMRSGGKSPAGVVEESMGS
eukprot:1533335-Rhodomonas_salina.1